MSTEKENAIADFQGRRVEQAKKDFQCEVDGILRKISTLSHSLSAAKKRLLDLNYTEPESLDV